MSLSSSRRSGPTEGSSPPSLRALDHFQEKLRLTRSGDSMLTTTWGWGDPCIRPKSKVRRVTKCPQTTIFIIFIINLTCENQLGLKKKLGVWKVWRWKINSGDWYEGSIKHNLRHSYTHTTLQRFRNHSLAKVNIVIYPCAVSAGELQRFSRHSEPLSQLLLILANFNFNFSYPNLAGVGKTFNFIFFSHTGRLRRLYCGLCCVHFPCLSRRPKQEKHNVIFHLISFWILSPMPNEPKSYVVFLFGWRLWPLQGKLRPLLIIIEKLLKVDTCFVQNCQVP